MKWFSQLSRPPTSHEIIWTCSVWATFLSVYQKKKKKLGMSYLSGDFEGFQRILYRSDLVMWEDVFRAIFPFGPLSMVGCQFPFRGSSSPEFAKNGGGNCICFRGDTEGFYASNDGHRMKGWARFGPQASICKGIGKKRLFYSETVNLL